MALAAMALAACGPAHSPALSPEQQRLAAQGWSDAALLKVTAAMDPSIRALARRHDPGLRRPDSWNRPQGWASLDIKTVPDLGFSGAVGQSAAAVNALRPFAAQQINPMRPFVLRADAADRARALKCLTQAVYFEAAREPEKGQQAVAQVVLNRVRHPAYPKSICGVVYQGAARLTGCQFTFTCDGSLRWAPEPDLWARAQGVAKRALAGFVASEVGSATHYHADYVSPYWAPTLVKLAKVGAHIFYRWTGPWGEPPAFVGRYVGREAILTPAVLRSVDPRTQGLFSPEKQGASAPRKVTLAVAGEVRTYNVVDPAAADGQRTRVLGTIVASRRQPTPDEVKKINDNLAAMEKTTAPASAAPDAAQAAAPTSAAAVAPPPEPKPPGQD